MTGIRSSGFDSANLYKFKVENGLFPISWGDMGIPKLEIFSILHLISSHHSPFPTLENFLHTKLHTILLATLV
jgi:hypothetical protein